MQSSTLQCTPQKQATQSQMRMTNSANTSPCFEKIRFPGYSFNQNQCKFSSSQKTTQNQKPFFTNILVKKSINPKGRFVYTKTCLDIELTSDSFLHSTIFCSSFSPPDWYKIKNAPKKFPIYPKYCEWNYELLGVFLNELVNFEKSPKSNDANLIFYRLIKSPNKTIKWKIYITILPEISVIASHEWLILLLYHLLIHLILNNSILHIVHLLNFSFLILYLY